MKTLSLFLIFTACAAAAQNDRAALQPGTLAEPWLTGGPDCLTVPNWQPPGCRHCLSNLSKAFPFSG